MTEPRRTLLRFLLTVIKRTAGSALRGGRAGFAQAFRERSARVDEVEPAWRDGLHEAQHCSIGWGTYGSPMVHVFRGDTNRVDIGNWCSIASEVEIFVGGNHPTNWPSTFPFREILNMPGAYTLGSPCSKGNVAIGSDVWLGRGCVILSGVSIGHGAVIATRAVVGRDVRPFAVMAGNPAVEVRRRFDDAAVERLMELAWWDWPEELVRENWLMFCDDDIAGFLDKAEQRRPAANALKKDGSS